MTIKTENRSSERFERHKVSAEFLGYTTGIGYAWQRNGEDYWLAGTGSDLYMLSTIGGPNPKHFDTMEAAVLSIRDYFTDAVLVEFRDEFEQMEIEE